MLKKSEAPASKKQIVPLAQQEHREAASLPSLSYVHGLLAPGRTSLEMPSTSVILWNLVFEQEATKGTKGTKKNPIQSSQVVSQFPRFMARSSPKP
jgi:hypothetical protein